MNDNEKRSLRFLTDIAETLCKNGKTEVIQEGPPDAPVYSLKVECGGNSMKMPIDDKAVGNPESKEFEEVAEKVIDGVLKTCRMPPRRNKTD